MLKAACSPSRRPSSARSSAGRIWPPPCRYSMGSFPTLVSTTWPLSSRTRYSSETTRPSSTRMSPPRGEAGHAAEGAEPARAGEIRRREQAEARDEVVEPQRAAAPVLRHRRGDERALAALGQAGDQAVGGEQRPGLPR